VERQLIGRLSTLITPVIKQLLSYAQTQRVHGEIAAIREVVPSPTRSRLARNYLRQSLRHREDHPWLGTTLHWSRRHTPRLSRSDRPHPSHALAWVPKVSVKLSGYLPLLTLTYWVIDRSASEEVQRFTTLGSTEEPDFEEYDDVNDEMLKPDTAQPADAHIPAWAWSMGSCSLDATAILALCCIVATTEDCRTIRDVGEADLSFRTLFEAYDTVGDWERWDSPTMTHLRDTIRRLLQHVLRTRSSSLGTILSMKPGLLSSLQISPLFAYVSAADAAVPHVLRSRARITYNSTEIRTRSTVSPFPLFRNAGVACSMLLTGL